MFWELFTGGVFVCSFVFAFSFLINTSLKISRPGVFNRGNRVYESEMSKCVVNIVLKYMY